MYNDISYFVDARIYFLCTVFQQFYNTLSSSELYHNIILYYIHIILKMYYEYYISQYICYIDVYKRQAFSYLWEHDTLSFVNFAMVVVYSSLFCLQYIVVGTEYV